METHATLPYPPTEHAAVSPNAYLYPEFAGWHGERYLKTLLRHILPMALYRTWEIFIDHQASGNECYLGLSRLAEIAGRSLRTMEKNLASLRAKHLLVERVERKVFRRATGAAISRLVVIKDFSGLYALAHDYHRWLESDEYVAPDRQLIAHLVLSPPLLARLRRFEDYRRVLFTHLPGRPGAAREADRWFTDDPPDPAMAEAVQEQAPEAETVQRGHPPAKEPSALWTTQRAAGSPKRITKGKRGISWEADSCASAPPSSSSEPPVKDEGAPEPAERQPSPTPEEPQETRSPVSTRSLRAPAGTGARPLSQGPLSTTACEEGDVPRDPGLRLVRAFVDEIAIPFGDRHLPGSRTRLLALVQEAHLDQPAEVLSCLVRAYVAARDTRRIRPEHCHPQTGQANRMPLFCTVFHRLLEAAAQGHGSHHSLWPTVQQELTRDPCLAAWWQQQRAWIGDPWPTAAPTACAAAHPLADAADTAAGPEHERACALPVNPYHRYIQSLLVSGRTPSTGLEGL